MRNAESSVIVGLGTVRVRHLADGAFVGFKWSIFRFIEAAQG